MAMTGAKPLPARIHILTGDPSHKGMPQLQAELEAEVPLPPGIPAPPRFLSGEGLVEWHRLCTELASIDLITKVDLGILAKYCQAWDRYSNAETMRDLEGDVITGARGGAIMNPWVSVSHKEQAVLYRCIQDLGFSPAARVRLRGAVNRVAPSFLPGSPGGSAGEFETFLADEDSNEG